MSHTQFLLLPVLFFMCCGQAAQAQKSGSKTAEISPVYIDVIAARGDDMASMLERYHLDGYTCNESKFLKINKLNKQSKIVAGNAYKLPVQLYKYNGKSIRSTINHDDWKIALRIEAFNKQLVEDGLRDDNFIESKNLWVPWHLLHCPDEVVEEMPENTPDIKPSKKGAKAAQASLYEEVTGQKGRNFPILGKKYAKTPLLDKKLDGKVFYLVSGHGGPDGGAEGHRAGHSLCEDEYAYDVTLRLLRLLSSHGAVVYLIVRDPNDGIRDESFLRCDKDEIVWGGKTIPLDQKERLQQRCDVINDLVAKNDKAGLTNQTLIEIHVDSRSRETRTDVFFYYRTESEISQKLANRFHRTFLQKYLKVRGQMRYNGTVSSRDLYMLRETTVPRAVYIELGNIRNDWDQQRLVLPNNRQALANWLCQALLSE